MAQYSDKVMEHFTNPKNVGEIPDADGVATVGNPVCGDLMTFYIKVENDRIKDVKFKTFGCGAAIAVSSITTEMAIGKTLDEALEITREEVAKKLGGLPSHKMHCSNLGADALHKAIENYRKKLHATKLKQKCVCPFCDKELKCSDLPYCQTCKMKFIFCAKCNSLIQENTSICPNCGKKIDTFIP